MAIANCTDDDVDFRTELPVTDKEKRDDQGGARAGDRGFDTLLSGHFKDQDLEKNEQVIFRDINWELKIDVPSGGAKVILVQQPIVDILLPQH